MNNQELTDRLIVLETAARDAGHLSRAKYGQIELGQIPHLRGMDLKDLKKAVKAKLGPVDQEVENFMLHFLHPFFPECSVLTEENSKAAKKFPQDAAYRLVVDPIDGTFNYIQGNPQIRSLIQEKYFQAHGKALDDFSMIFSNCLALQDMSDGSFVLSVVHFPLLKKTYSAAKDQGAFLNGEPLKIKSKKSYHPADLFCLSKSVSKELGPSFNHKESICASDGLVGVADGRFMGYISNLGHLEDVGPGLFIIQEAGGTVRTLDMQPPNFQTKNGWLGYTAVAGPSENYLRGIVEMILPK